MSIMNIELPDYTVDEIFQEVIEDESWEPDPQKRTVTAKGLQFLLYF